MKESKKVTKLVRYPDTSTPRKTAESRQITTNPVGIASPRAMLRRVLIAKARETLEDGADAAAKYLKDAASGAVPAKRERIDAAKTLLDRVGLVPPERSTPEDAKDVQEMSGAELHNMLQTVEAELSGRAKPINGPLVTDATAEPVQPNGMFD